MLKKLIPLLTLKLHNSISKRQLSFKNNPISKYITIKSNPSRSLMNEIPIYVEFGINDNIALKVKSRNHCETHRLTNLVANICYGIGFNLIDVSTNYKAYTHHSIDPSLEPKLTLDNRTYFLPPLHIGCKFGKIFHKYFN